MYIWHLNDNEEPHVVGLIDMIHGINGSWAKGLGPLKKSTMKLFMACVMSLIGKFAMRLFVARVMNLNLD
jgi:hypothetical protein